MRLTFESLGTAPGASSGTTPAFKMTMIWIVGCLLAFVAAMNFLPAALVDGHYVPVSNDSFYHARRILDTVANPGGFYEFDTHIHYPEGSWITWPWGYDYVMAQIVRLDLWLFGGKEPMKVLAYIPVFAITIMLALVLALTAVLRLSMPMRALVVLIVSLSPLTQTLHAVGMVDHHFAEHIFILASILCSILWFREPQNTGRAISLGLVLGTSVAVHNGLFILQLPLLGALLIAWLRGEPIDKRSTVYLAVALLLGTLAAALPAEALRRGFFEFYLLSWFHVYVAACTAVITVLLSRFPNNPRRLIGLAVIALLLAIPLIAQVIYGGNFIVGHMEALADIDEVQSPVKLAFSAAGAERISMLYSLLIWLSPAWLAIIVVQLFRDRRPEYRYFWLVSAFTYVLMLFQLRFFYYGSIALYIVPFWCFDQLRNWRPRLSKVVLAGSVIATALALVYPLKSILFETVAPGLDPLYGNSREVYPVLAEACKRAPGVVIGNGNEGHYVRYHTDCYVIGNNFRMTPQHAQKILYQMHLLRLRPEQLVKQAPEVRYVLAHLNGAYIFGPDGSASPSSDAQLREVNLPLDSDLLLSPPGQLPEHFRALYLVTFKDLPHPIAGLFEVVHERQITGTATTSAAADSKSSAAPTH